MKTRCLTMSLTFMRSSKVHRMHLYVELYSSCRSEVGSKLRMTDGVVKDDHVCSRSAIPPKLTHEIGVQQETIFTRVHRVPFTSFGLVGVDWKDTSIFSLTYKDHFVPFSIILHQKLHHHHHPLPTVLKRSKCSPSFQQTVHTDTNHMECNRGEQITRKVNPKPLILLRRDEIGM